MKSRQWAGSRRISTLWLPAGVPATGGKAADNYKREISLLLIFRGVAQLRLYF